MATRFSVDSIGGSRALYNTNDFTDALDMRLRWAVQLGNRYTVIVVNNETGEIMVGI